jgi:Mor family transcriptional regulator
VNAPLAEDLPESLADVVEAIGIAATLKLIERFGGIRIYVPLREHISDDHELARAIGLVAARKLAEIWGKERMPLPRAAKAMRLARDRALRRDYQSISASQCALKYQVTERQVYWIVGRDEEERRQADLF